MRSKSSPLNPVFMPSGAPTAHEVSFVLSVGNRPGRT
jgi:hypothetical protein